MVRDTMSRTFIKFLLVGVVNTLVGLGLMLLLLNAIGFTYWWSTFIGNTVGAIVSYSLNRSYTFRSDVVWWRGLLPFAIVILACYVIAYGLGMTIVEWILPLIVPQVSHTWIDNLAVVAGMGMYTILNFIGQRWFVFGDRKDNRRDTATE